MKKLTFAIVFSLTCALGVAQDKYFTRTGHVAFLSDTPAEKIEAHNNQTASVLDIKTGEIDLIILIKSFEFKNQMMQDHFNENYMESDSFPKATFKGKIKDKSKVNFKKDGVYNVEVEGDVTIHGITKKATMTGTLEVKKKQIVGKGTFGVVLKDFNIKPPKKVAETVNVTADLIYEPKK